MTSLFKPIKLILEFYYMSNSLTFEIFKIILRNFYPRWDVTWKLPVLNFKEIDDEIDEKHALQIYQNKCGPEYNVKVSS